MKRGLIIIAFLLILPTAFAFCGDGLVDDNGKENCQTCPEDNPCFVDQICQEGTCAQRLIPPLFLKEDNILNSVINVIKRKISASKIKKEILSVAIFGSVSAREDHPSSDIDIAVIVKNAKAKAATEHLFEEIDTKISREFGNAISPYLNTKAEVKAKHEKGLAVIKDIIKSHDLIYGERLERLL